MAGLPMPARWVALVAGLGLVALRPAGPAYAGLVEPAASLQIPVDPPLPRPRVGERLVFHGRWMGIPVGSGWIAVQALTEYAGRAAYLIEAEGHTNGVLSTVYPVHDRIMAYLDAHTLQPLMFEKHQSEGRYRADEVVTFDHARGMATYRSLRNGSVKEIPITDGVHDIVSVFYWLRTRSASVDRAVSVDIYADEKVYQAQVRPLKLTMLELLKRGTFPCVIAEPTASLKGILRQRGRMVVYVSTGASRIPLQVKIWTPWGMLSGVIDQASLAEGLAQEGVSRQAMMASDRADAGGRAAGP